VPAETETLTSLLRGRASAEGMNVHLSVRDGAALHDKMRQAYWWLTNNAVICPTTTWSSASGRVLKTQAGDEIGLHDAMSYSSYVLIPMLTLFTCRRALLSADRAAARPPRRS
jgi:hypothetical protein